VNLAITETDIARSREDPRFKQVLLAKVLEQLLGTLSRLQRDPRQDEAGARSLREGAMMAVQLADLIRSIDDKLRLAARA
jgi:hypothetical protein